MMSPHCSPAEKLKAFPSPARGLPTKLLLLPDDNIVQRNNS
jgi:hypothetical protein